MHNIQHPKYSISRKYKPCMNRLALWNIIQAASPPSLVVPGSACITNLAVICSCKNTFLLGMEGFMEDLNQCTHFSINNVELARPSGAHITQMTLGKQMLSKTESHWWMQTWNVGIGYVLLFLGPM